MLVAGQASVGMNGLQRKRLNTKAYGAGIRWEGRPISGHLSRRGWKLTLPAGFRAVTSGLPTNPLRLQLPHSPTACYDHNGGMGASDVEACGVTFPTRLAPYVHAASCRAWGKYGVHARYMDQAAFELFTKLLPHVFTLRRVWNSVVQSLFGLGHQRYQVLHRMGDASDPDLYPVGLADHSILRAMGATELQQLL